ncbi:MAG: phosphate acyltransferase PlsX [Coriobacteriales bacterium]|jgi:glycerol-3-phosphate acyltransferase PlsX|nr:phosphate acyltransferase PlsX [Coriobacteriales bacterium]
MTAHGNRSQNTTGEQPTSGTAVADHTVEPVSSGFSAPSFTICVDTLGGDNAPAVVMDALGQILASDSPFDRCINLLLTGFASDIQPLANAHPQRVVAVPTSQRIEMDEHPATAVKQKRDSSIVVGAKLLRSGQADAFFSSGSTGAIMAAATLFVGRIKGVKRPAIATLIPAPKGHVLLLDAGANSEVEPEYLLQFAHMGSIYAAKALGIARPRLALLNVGAEASKGSRPIQAAYELLQLHVDNFYGNAEGDDLFSGRFDVIVSGGFTGNVVLKAMEGAVSGLLSELKKLFMASHKNKVAAALIKKDLMALKDQLDIDLIGGAPLLGLNKSVVIGHGSAGALAIANGIRQAARMAQGNVPQLIAASLAVDADDKTH